jgi:hypothetical protein
LVSRLSTVGDSPSGGLLFHFVNEQPIFADDLGRLFVSLARDYRQLTGRRLVVTRVEPGTLTAVLKDAVVAFAPYVADAVEVAKGLNGVANFASTLRDLLEKLRNSGPKVTAKKSAGQTALEHFLKVVAKSGGEGEFEFSTKTENIKARVTSGEAIKLREHAKNARKKQRPARPADPLALTDDRVRQLALGLAKLRDSDVTDAIPALVDALRRAGLESFVEMIASELAIRGHSQIADALRVEVARSGRNMLPPITRG